MCHKKGVCEALVELPSVSVDKHEEDKEVEEHDDDEEAQRLFGVQGVRLPSDEGLKEPREPEPDQNVEDVRPQHVRHRHCQAGEWVSGWRGLGGLGEECGGRLGGQGE